jgi:hypothetical protein
LDWLGAMLGVQCQIVYFRIIFKLELKVDLNDNVINCNWILQFFFLKIGFCDTKMLSGVACCPPSFYSCVIILY